MLDTLLRFNSSNVRISRLYPSRFRADWGLELWEAPACEGAAYERDGDQEGYTAVAAEAEVAGAGEARGWNEEEGQAEEEEKEENDGRRRCGRIRKKKTQTLRRCWRLRSWRWWQVQRVGLVKWQSWWLRRRPLLEWNGPVRRGIREKGTK